MKLCNKCNEIKEESCFSKDKTRKDGLRYCCKKCENKNIKKYYKNNIQSYKEKQKIYMKTQKGKLNSYKSGAKQRNIEFDLTFEQFLTFWQKPCYYCDDEIETIGIDRIDSSIGYSLKNCVSCCIRCNRIFMQYDKNETINHIQKMLNNLNK